MSRDITFRIETKDEFGEWELIEWFTEYEYNGIPFKTFFKNFLNSFNIKRYKMIKQLCGKDYSVNYFSNIWNEFKKLCKHNSDKPKSYIIDGKKLMKKNSFSEGACCYSGDIEDYINVHNGIPQDASFGLQDAIKNEEEDSDGYKYHYNYKYFSLRELQVSYEKEIDNLFVALDDASIKLSNAENHKTIMNKLERIENILLNVESYEGAEENKKEEEEDDCFECNKERLEFLQTEKFWDIIALIRLNNYVSFLTDNVKKSYSCEDNVRIIYYIS